MAHVIVEPKCVKCESCVQVCPVGAINSDDSAPQMFINPEECLDCGSCMSTCPSEAIYPDTDLPAEFQQFAEVNANFYK